MIEMQMSVQDRGQGQLFGMKERQDFIRISAGINDHSLAIRMHDVTVCIQRSKRHGGHFEHQFLPGEKRDAQDVDIFGPKHNSPFWTRVPA